MTTYYRATFTDGHVETRSTQNRTYAAAVRLTFTYPGRGDREGQTDKGQEVTWAGTPALAQAAASRGPGKYRLTQHGEIAEAVEISAAEYRTLKASP